MIGSPHQEVEGVPVAADPVQEIALHVRAELERLYDLSDPFAPGQVG